MRPRRRRSSSSPARFRCTSATRRSDIDVPAGGLVRVEPGTPLQSANHGDEDLLVYAYGYPPESEHAELMDPAV